MSQCTLSEALFLFCLACSLHSDVSIISPLSSSSAVFYSFLHKQRFQSTTFCCTTNTENIEVKFNLTPTVGILSVAIWIQSYRAVRLSSPQRVCVHPSRLRIVIKFESTIKYLHSKSSTKSWFCAEYYLMTNGD